MPPECQTVPLVLISPHGGEKHLWLHELAGTGSLSVYAGVGKLPSQLALARRIFTGTPPAIATSPDHVTAPWALSVVAAHAALARYGAAVFSTPLNATEDDGEAFARLSAGLLADNATFCGAFTAGLEYAALWLDKMTVPKEIGLLYYPRNALGAPLLPDVANVALNLQVCALLALAAPDSARNGNFSAHAQRQNFGETPQSTVIAMFPACRRPALCARPTFCAPLRLPAKAQLALQPQRCRRWQSSARHGRPRELRGSSSSQSQLVRSHQRRHMATLTTCCCSGARRVRAGTLHPQCSKKPPAQTSVTAAELTARSWPT